MAKQWRDAATVIIASKSMFPKEHATGKIKKLVDLNVLKSENTKEKNLKLSYSGFKVLTLKRSAGSSFMPSTFVFPGGAISAADSCSDWMQIFEHNGVMKEIDEFCKQEQENKHLIFQNNSCEEIPKLLSLRISGIRETFEECGVLLCKHKTAHPSDPSRWASYLSGHELNKWQKKVQADPSALVALCKHFECYPDVWSMNYWSNWLTPSNMPKRFNTAFFLTLLDSLPPVSIDNMEVNDIKWSAPSELLELSNSRTITLPPPQFYELSRLCNFKDIEQLASFAASKTNRVEELWMPIQIKATDGEITVLPGDDSYPSEFDITTPTKQRKVDATLEELRKGCNKLHRIEYKSNGIPLMVIKM